MDNTNTNEHEHLSNEESDRISDLPDEILQHVLSFLGTKEAAQKSLLSKRWVNLWSSSPCLNFLPSDFVPLVTHLFYLREREQHVKFQKYVETMLYHRQASLLHTFRIIFPQILDQAICSDLVQICVSYAMKHNCQIFSMVASIPSEKLCTCLFVCESLKEMCLRTIFWSSHGPKVIPEAVHLPHIKRLHLKSSTIDRKSISRLLSGCPILEELTLESCHIDDLCIFNHMFKYLHLLDCGLKLPHYKENLYIKSSIVGNIAESTIRIGSSRVDFIWKTPGISAVDINPSSFMHNFFRCIDLDDYLRDLSGVTVLKLYRVDFQMLEIELKKLGEFQNLKELSLSGWCMTCNFNPVALFLQKAPNIRRLTLCNFEYPCQRRTMCYIPMLDISRIHTELWRYHVKAHKLAEALVPCRQVVENVKVILFQFDKSFYCV